jgi:hypothetical protein
MLSIGRIVAQTNCPNIVIGVKVMTIESIWRLWQKHATGAVENCNQSDKPTL